MVTTSAPGTQENKHFAPEVSLHGGSLRVAAGREGCLFIEPLHHRLSILCLRGMTPWKSCCVLTVEVHKSKCMKEKTRDFLCFFHLSVYLLLVLCKRCRCDSPEKLKALLPRLEQELKDSGKFKDFYQFTFNFAKNPGQKGLGKKSNNNNNNTAR